MPDYETMYHKAFNALTDAEELIQKAGILIRATQQQCEDMYVEASEDLEAPR